MSIDTAEGVLVPGKPDRHFAGVSVTVVGAVFAFTSKVNAAVCCTHVGHSNAQDILFAELDGLLRFKRKGSVGSKVGSQADTVEPDSGVGGNAFKAEENALGYEFVIVQGETLEVESAVLGHEQLVKRSFPDVGNIHGFGVGRVGCVPAVGNSGIFRIPLHLPVAIECIGVARFELTTFCSQSRRSTRLSYTPFGPNIAKKGCFEVFSLKISIFLPCF